MHDIDLPPHLSPDVASGDPLLEYRWVARDRDGAPVADHHLMLLRRPAEVADTRARPALDDGASLLHAAASRSVRWSTETWPRVIRPEALTGRRLAIDEPRAALLLIERGDDDGAEVVIVHHATVLAEHSSVPEYLQPLAAAAGRALGGSPPEAAALATPLPQAQAQG